MFNNELDHGVRQGREDERLRRQQLIRFALLLCIMILFLDRPENVHPLPSSSSSGDSDGDITGGQPSTVYQQRLTNVMRNLHSQESYPRNITGIYQGTWVTYGKNEIKVSINSTESDTTFKDIDQNSTPAETTRNGQMLIQIRSINVAEVPELDFVYGVVKLFKADSTSSDVLYPLQGSL